MADPKIKISLKNSGFARVTHSDTRPDNEQLFLTKNIASLYCWSFGPSETGKTHFIYNWIKVGLFQHQFDKIYFFINTRNKFTMLLRKTENLEFVQGVNFELSSKIFKKQPYNALVNLGRFKRRCLQFKSVGWYCYCWRTSSIESCLQKGLFVSSKETWARRWAVELQNKHNVRFESPCDVMQFNALSA